MRRLPRYAWRYGLPLLVAAAVGWYFFTKLNQPGLWNAQLAPDVRWLLLAALAYLAAYTVWGAYYVVLLNNQGAHAPAATGMRAYFVSQLGKYVPGKVLVIVIRVGMLGNIGISRTAVGITAVYESMVWVGSAALVGVALLPASLWDGLRDQLRARGGDLPDLHRAWLILPVALAPIGMVGLNRFVNRINRWRKGPDAPQLPRVKLHLVILGLVFDAAGWLLLGGCLLLTLVAFQPALSTDADLYWNLTSINAIAYVLGFVAFFMPAGIGVRDIALQLLLAIELAARLNLNPAAADGLAAFLAVMFRVLGTVVELLTAGLLFWLAPSAARAAVRREAAAVEAAEAAHE